MSKVGVIFKKWADSSLVVRILIGLVIGAVLGLVLPGWKWIGILGTIFVGALKAIAPVLVGILVTASVAKAGSGVGVRFRKVIGLYLASTLTAALIATLASTVFPVTLTLQDVAEGSAPGSLADIFRGLLSNIVANPVWSLASANYVGILFWAILMGLAI